MPSGTCRKVTCPYCNQELYLVPEVVEMGKAELIYENQPNTTKDEIF